MEYLQQLTRALILQKKQTGTSAEDIWLTIFFKRGNDINVKVHVCCVYIPPNDVFSFTWFMNNLSNIINNSPNDKFVICGDFNLPNIEWIRQDSIVT